MHSPRFLTLLLGASLLLIACNETYVPKPRAYPRILFPEHTYQAFQPKDCPFAFEHPTYSTIIRDTLRIGKEAAHPCWLQVSYPSLNSSIYLSYKNINEQETPLKKLIEDAYHLNMKHVIKADYIEDSLVVTEKGGAGLYYQVGGNAASSTQFFLTDSIAHFLWASFYVKDTPNEDSIAPIIQFIRTDIQHLIQTFEWKDGRSNKK